jgi:RNA polymerase sigma-70 factor (ECF subfamily)
MRVTEQELVRLAQAGDAEAFGALVRTFQAGVYGFCLRLTGKREDALDLTNETFLRAYQSLATFDNALPFRPWLLRIAANLTRDWLKRRERSPVPVEDEHLAAIPDTELPPLTRLVAEDDRQGVREAVQRLPEPYRTVIILHYFNQLSYQEISESLGIPIGTVGTQIHRARRLLRQALTAQEVTIP